jgi:Dna[CI] antecedent, DciA
MIPVQDFMPGALAAILRKAPLTPEKVAFAWRSAVGPAVDRVTAVELRDGVLRVVAKDAVWQREVERSAAIIRARLAALLGQDVVRYVDVISDSTAAVPRATATGPGAEARSASPSADGSDSVRRRR